MGSRVFWSRLLSSFLELWMVCMAYRIAVQWVASVTLSCVASSFGCLDQTPVRNISNYIQTAAVGWSWGTPWGISSDRVNFPYVVFLCACHLTVSFMFI